MVTVLIDRSIIRRSIEKRLACASVSRPLGTGADPSTQADTERRQHSTCVRT